MSWFDAIFGDSNKQVPERTSFSGYAQVVTPRSRTFEPPAEAQEQFAEAQAESRLDVQRRVVDVIHAGGVPDQKDLDLLKIRMTEEVKGRRVIPYESHTDIDLHEEARIAEEALRAARFIR